MLDRFRTTSILHERNRNYSILALFVLLSSGFGVIFSATVEQHYFNLMRIAACCPVSISDSLMAVLVPYIVSVLLVINSKPWLVYLIISTRIFLFTAAAWAVFGSFGTAGWVIGFMFLFPDIFFIPMLLWLAIRKFENAGNQWYRIPCMVYVVLVGIVNYFTVSPFLANLLNTYESMGR